MSAISALQQIKLFLVDHLHLAKDALHIYVALTVFFGSCLLLGWRTSQLRPLLAVLIVALAGEAWDLRDQLLYQEPIAPLEHVKDILNTLAVPAVIFTLARYSRVFNTVSHL